MKELLRRLFPFAAYGAFYFGAFFLSIYIAFPYDRVRDRVIVEFAKQQKSAAAPMVLDIDELRPYWFSGVELKGVRITIPPKDTFSASKDEEKTPTVIELEEVHARVSVLKRIIGKTEVNFSAKAFGGDVTGTLTDTSGERSIELDVENVNIGDVTPIASMIGLPMVGTLHGSISLSLPDKRTSKANGTVNMSIAGLSIGDGKSKIKNTLALPRMNVGDLTLDAEVAAGAVKVNKFAATGTDLEFAAEALTLRDVFAEPTRPLRRSQVQRCVQEQERHHEGLFGAPGSTAPALFELG
ncbi:MAG: type II secretion system protein GspN [Polyangiaceae bacterium]